MARRGWFVSDFTWRAQDPAPCSPGRTRQSPTAKYLDSRPSKRCWNWPGPSARLNRSIGVYAETKHPSYHAGLGLALEDRRLAVVRAGTVSPPASSAPVIVQSFRWQPQVPAQQDSVRTPGTAGECQRRQRRRQHRRYAKPTAGSAQAIFDFAVARRRPPMAFAGLLTPAGCSRTSELRRRRRPTNERAPYHSVQVGGCQQGLARLDCSFLNGDGKIDERDRVMLPEYRLFYQNARGRRVRGFSTMQRAPS